MYLQFSVVHTRREREKEMENIFENTKKAAYYVWEYSKSDNALASWYCTEDIAYFIYKHKIFSVEEIRKIVTLNKNDMGYIAFTRHIAYRIYIYTKNEDALKNWYAAEGLIKDYAWQEAIILVVHGYRNDKAYQKVRSEYIRNVMRK